MPEDAEDRLRDFLRNGKEWARLRTSVPGIFVLKLPSYRGSRDRLAVEVNPVDEGGSPRKRRGLVLRDREELEEFRRLLSDGRLEKLLEELERVNPEEGKGGEGLLKI
ncbi:hypothetical protein [Conexivisphaera calida]|uniref:hypothetical protein n=1 Tax=Conexivisphaera calida TaxID=1874277 RepID=UPI00157BAB4C|nr:hypothetical protein [Conexivisphaera calida]